MVMPVIMPSCDGSVDSFLLQSWWWAADSWVGCFMLLNATGLTGFVFAKICMSGDASDISFLWWQWCFLPALNGCNASFLDWQWWFLPALLWMPEFLSPWLFLLLLQFVHVQRPDWGVMVLPCIMMMIIPLVSAAAICIWWNCLPCMCTIVVYTLWSRSLSWFVAAL